MRILKKHSYIVFNIVVLFIIVAYCYYNWSWMVSNTVTFGFFAALIGAIVGGIISGVGSYVGGIRGSKESYELTNSSEERSSIKKLLYLLKFTYDTFMYVDSHESEITTMKNQQYIYDREWQKYISFLELLSYDETRTIVNWFYCWQAIEDVVNRKGGVSIKFIRGMLSKYAPLISDIINKISESYKSFT